MAVNGLNFVTTAVNLASGALAPDLSLEPVIKVEAANGTTCDVLLKRIERSNNWLDAFTVLVFLVAASAAAMLVTAVLSAKNEEVVGAIVGGVGTVLASGAFAALLKLRKSQQEELDHYVDLRKQHNCA